MIKIRTKKYNQWDRQTRRCLAALTLKGGSGMRDDINSTPHIKTWVAFDGDLIVGWATYDDWHDRASFYVRKHYRRKGIGKRLFNCVMKWNKDTEVCIWDDRSACFFTSVNAQNVDVCYQPE